MATSLSGGINMQIALSYASALDLRTVTDPVAVANAVTIADGTGANQAQKVWADTRTTDNTGESFDFIGGTVTDAFGATVTLARWVCLYVKAAAANAVNLQLVAAATTTFFTCFAAAADAIVLPPGGAVMFLCPTAAAYAMTAGNGDTLTIKAATAGNVTYDIVIVGS